MCTFECNCGSTVTLSFYLVPTSAVVFLLSLLHGFETLHIMSVGRD